MNLNNQMHKNLVVESLQNVQHGNKRSQILNQSSREMNNTELAACCVREINYYRRGEPTSERYTVELLRRAIVQGEPEAWNWVQQCYCELIASWLRHHPQWEVASKLGSSEEYVARTIKRFKQITMLNKDIEWSSMAEIFQYLRVCLNGVILEILRVYSCSKEIHS
jgi:hypothetical protein